MNVREKLALQKEIRESLAGLKEPDLSVRDKLSLQKQVRENLLKLGKGIKADNPAVETPLFDKLKAGEIDDTNLMDMLEDIFKELTAAGNEESQAVEMMKEPLIAAIQKAEAGTVVQEDVDIEESLFKPPAAMPRPNPSLSEKGIYFLNQNIDDQSVFPIIQAIIEHNAREEKLDKIT
ncbi:MAG: hypothetical protein GY866_34850, partial [Proteobacteria bacterium]|nr:hypothetical protein [Pseudomonadota bacterium]